MPKIGRIWNKSDSFDCFCGTIQIIFFFYKLELKQFPDTMSRSIIFENQEQMQCVNFGSDDFFPSARNELDTCSLNQKLMFVKKRVFKLSHKNSQLNLICSKFSQYLAHNYPRWDYCQKFTLVSKRSIWFASLEKKI